ncbi:Isoflavone reductase like protein IRL [Daldinia childiae]|uniref:Isoflavone reductase like protein IRL n=1 Tax=Daldinia childiae TaxID=326645 RepID=UPI0014468DC5|nr:Isoflavone reductase like protein IRL [Daldinia childiae]KAF3062066.1 Isoflavone reductase like protein IRL [Daldinia childiae]
MPTQIKNVIFIGASGDLGGPVITHFLSLHNAQAPFTVSALTRQNSTAILPSGINVIRTDYTIASLESALKGQDVVISMLGYDGIHLQKTIIDAAIKAGVKRFIPSEFGSRTYDDKVRDAVPIFGGKRQIVEYLKANEGKISWTAVINGALFDLGLKVGFLGFDLQSHRAKLFDAGTVPFGATNLHTISHALFSLLSSPSNFADLQNKYIHIASHMTTQQEILAALEKITGKTWEKVPVNGRELSQTSLEKFQKGDSGALTGLIQAMTWGKLGDENLGDFRGEKLYNERLGLPKEDLEADVAAVLEGKAP